MGGFSQGAIISLATLLRYKGKTPIGGVVCESGQMSLTMENRFTSPSALAVQSQTPIFLYHGSDDGVLYEKVSYASYAYLRDVVYKNTPENYTFEEEMNMGHYVDHNKGMEEYQVQ